MQRCKYCDESVDTVKLLREPEEGRLYRVYSCPCKMLTYKELVSE
jgi:hypothetical protein